MDSSLGMVVRFLTLPTGGYPLYRVIVCGIHFTEEIG